MKKTVLVAIKKPNQPLEVKEIEDKLEVLQEIVEGYIEAIYPMENLEDHSITIFGNEEAKMIHQPSNFWLYNQQDCMCGTALFFKDDEAVASYFSEHDVYISLRALQSMSTQIL